MRSIDGSEQKRAKTLVGGIGTSELICQRALNNTHSAKTEQSERLFLFASISAELHVGESLKKSQEVDGKRCINR